MVKPAVFNKCFRVLGLGWLFLLWAEAAAPAATSDLSSWLSEEVTGELLELLDNHPRFAERELIVEGAQQNALTEGIAITLDANLSSQSPVQLAGVPWPDLAVGPAPRAIDALDCLGSRDSALLTIRAETLANGRDRVELALYDAVAAASAAQSWQWLGSFSRDERHAFGKAPSRNHRDGSLEAPWLAGQVRDAAQVLQREMACALRPSIRTKVVLDWQTPGPLPDPARDALNHARHLLASYGEIGIGESNSDYRVSSELLAFHGDTWQLRLRAIPQRPGLVPLDASTYFSLPAYELPASVDAFQPPLKAPPLALVDRGPAFDHLQVELIDALQGQAKRSRAALEVKIRLSNTSPWPIDYAFSLSGGHYQHCVPEAAYYRHDRYGYVEGRLEAGESLIRRMVIEGARHNPNPWFGPRRCAGFRSLEGFEDFSGKGRSVTQFVRWAMI